MDLPMEQRVGISIWSQHTQQGSSALGLDLSLTSTCLLPPVSERCGDGFLTTASTPSLCSPLFFIFLSYPTTYPLPSPLGSLLLTSSHPLPYSLLSSPLLSSTLFTSLPPSSPLPLLPSPLLWFKSSFTFVDLRWSLCTCVCACVFACLGTHAWACVFKLLDRQTDGRT